MEISGLDRVSRASPGTSINLNCLVTGLEEEVEEEGPLQLSWSERRLGEEEKEEKVVSRVSLDGELHTTFLPGFTSLLVTEYTEDAWRYSWRLIIEKVSAHNSAVYQCKVIET